MVERQKAVANKKGHLNTQVALSSQIAKKPILLPRTAANR
jgi:hypothetical protein